MSNACKSLINPILKKTKAINSLLTYRKEEKQADINKKNNVGKYPSLSIILLSLKYTLIKILNTINMLVVII
jgi:VanZ family protein